MEVIKYLCVRYPKKSRYDYPKAVVRITTQQPRLASQEVVFELNIKLPDELFLRPQLKASIAVSENLVTAPVIEAEVLSNITEVIQKELGVDLSISLVEPQKEEG